MSFRLRITLSMIAVIAVLYSISGAALISMSFNAAVEKEEKAAVGNTRLTLRMLEMVGEGESWFNEEELTDTLQQISERSSFDAVKLMRLGEDAFANASAGAETSLSSENSTELPSENAADSPTDNAASRRAGNASVGDAIFSEGITDDFPDPSSNAAEGEITVTYPTARTARPRLFTTSTLAIGDDAYVLQIANDLGSIYRVRQQQRGLFGRIYLILIALAAGLSWLTATVVTRSLRKLSQASREIASGNLAYRTNITTEDEIGRLSHDFDRMAEKLEENITAIQEEADRKERFMGAFTHELKTPMTSIIGYADLIRSQALTPEEQEDAVNYIFSEGKRLENMSLKLLDLFVADKNDLACRSISPASLLNDTAAHLKPVYEKAGIAITVSAGDGECSLEPDLFRTLLINLMDNARKAMPDGGRLFVGARRERGRIAAAAGGQTAGDTGRDAGEGAGRRDGIGSRRGGSHAIGASESEGGAAAGGQDVSSSRRGGSHAIGSSEREGGQTAGWIWHFAVADTGKGMAPEELKHITEAFYRVDKARARAEGSAGLGLALCEKIVSLHHGTLSFESEPGKGTTVHVRIPEGEVEDKSLLDGEFAGKSLKTGELAGKSLKAGENVDRDRNLRQEKTLEKKILTGKGGGRHDS